MKKLLQWLSRTVAAALSLVLAAVLLPYASRWASSLLPDLSGAALNTSILLSHQMQESARLETTVVEDEGVMNATTSAMLLGTVQSVTIQYVYRASLGIDLRKVLRKTPEELPAALAEAIFQKPRAHCFGDPASVTEQKRMNEIGG